jgi:hypothetical protein
VAVHAAFLSFFAGSSAGMDGRTPQYLKDMILIEGASDPLLSAICAFFGLVFLDSVPAERKSNLSSLVPDYWPFLRKMEGERSIAVGLSLRRLAGKIINKAAT